MKSGTVHIGVDVSKEKLDIYVPAKEEGSAMAFSSALTFFASAAPKRANPRFTIVGFLA